MSDKLRDGFEAWATDGGWLDLRIGDDGFYMDNETYCAFEAWKASRAALIVDLPEKAALMSASSVYSSLDDAGVSYK